MLVTSVVLIVLTGAVEGEGKWHVAATLITAGTIGRSVFVIAALSYPYSLLQRL